MNKAIIILSVVLLPTFAWGSDYQCVNLLKAAEIRQRLDDHTYVAQAWYGMIPPHPVLLKTDGTTFGSNGLIGRDLWVKIPNGKPETTELQNANGFPKSYVTIRESDVCAKEGPIAQKAAEHAPPIPDPRNEPCEKKLDNGTIMTNPFCKPPKKSQAKIDKEKADRDAYVKLRDACEGGYKTGPECVEVMKNR